MDNPNPLHWPSSDDSISTDWEDLQLDYDDDPDNLNRYTYAEVFNAADRDGDGDLWILSRNGSGHAVRIEDEWMPIHQLDEWVSDVDGEDMTDDDYDAEVERRESVQQRAEGAADAANEYASGPMMNYTYPMNNTADDDETARWAWEIRDLPLCVVAVGDHTVGLALTGGGMDLSWEIADAFIRCGYRPPTDVVRELPKMAGRGESDRDRAIVQAVVDTLAYRARNIRHSADHMVETYGVSLPDDL